MNRASSQRTYAMTTWALSTLVVAVSTARVVFVEIEHEQLSIPA